MSKVAGGLTIQVMVHCKILLIAFCVATENTDAHVKLEGECKGEI